MGLSPLYKAGDEGDFDNGIEAEISKDPSRMGQLKRIPATIPRYHRVCLWKQPRMKLCQYAQMICEIGTAYSQGRVPKVMREGKDLRRA